MKKKPNSFKSFILKPSIQSSLRIIESRRKNSFCTTPQLARNMSERRIGFGCPALPIHQQGVFTNSKVEEVSRIVEASEDERRIEFDKFRLRNVEKRLLLKNCDREALMRKRKLIQMKIGYQHSEREYFEHLVNRRNDTQILKDAFNSIYKKEMQVIIPSVNIHKVDDYRTPTIERIKNKQGPYSRVLSRISLNKCDTIQSLDSPSIDRKSLKLVPNERVFKKLSNFIVSLDKEKRKTIPTSSFISSSPTNKTKLNSERVKPSLSLMQKAQDSKLYKR